MTIDAAERRAAVRERYARVATTGGSCCGPANGDAAADHAIRTVGDGCCSPETATPEAGPATADAISCAVGYDESEISRVPEGANLGLGCGNPVALASLTPGETVVDLGAGAGFDCFLAAERVGPTGRVIGVDMTPEMVERARANAVKGGFTNVEFRLGEIEALPVRDGSVDVVISNCVLNLSADRPRVLAEVMRVLRPGGRFMISDLVSVQAVPDFIAASKESLVGCLPVQVAEYEADLAAAGFAEVTVEPRQRYPSEHIPGDPRVRQVIEREPWREGEVRDFVESIHGGAIAAVKRAVATTHTTIDTERNHP
ncbi:MAG: arsenite methyltransferase [Gemmatimonadota bacterium]|nr:arsenite methyltransferase [Gemmatimonadota bacterium]MDE2985390.1 arsenite methyltransferase [Gemmatimonadota bacterium]